MHATMLSAEWQVHSREFYVKGICEEVEAYPCDQQ